MIVMQLYVVLPAC